MMNNGILRLFATSAKGLEELVAAELADIGANDIKAQTGGVSYTGSQETLYKSNLWLRTAHKILLQMTTFPCRDESQLYDGVKAMSWENVITPKNTFAVDATVRDSVITHSRFASLKTKDAIVDRIRDIHSERPDINIKNPDIRVNIHIRDNRCTVSLDSSGESLHKRGYRVGQGPAPLKETLAAAIVMLTEWNGSMPLVDPMCGSGTIPIEAALIAANIAPGLYRNSFAFQRWADYDTALWKKLNSEARGKMKQHIDTALFGYDHSKAAIEQAKGNAFAAGVDDFIGFDVRKLSELRVPPAPGVLVVNPPYGERLGEQEQLRGLYKTLGDVLKNECKGYTAFVFTGNLELAKSIGLRTSKRIPLFNGPIESRLLRFELY